MRPLKLFLSIALCLTVTSNVLAVHFPVDTGKFDMYLHDARINLLIGNGLAAEEAVGITALEDIFGKPYSIKRTTVVNKHNLDQKDTVVLVNYPGIQFRFYTTTDQQFLTHTAITESNVKLGFGIHVGVNQQSLIQALGMPSEVQGNKWIYENEDEALSIVVFEVQDQKIKQINFCYYLD